MTGDERATIDGGFDSSRRAVARAALLGAAGLLLVVAVAFSILPAGSPVSWWRQYDATTWLFFVGVFGFVGATLGVGWQQGCRVAAAGIVGLLLVLPAVPPIAFGESPDSWFVLGGTAVVVVPFALVAVPIEHVRRTADRSRPTRLEWLALAVGVGHLLAVDRLKTALEHRPLLPPPTELGAVDPYGLALLIAFTVSLVLLGAVPVVLAGRLRLLTPPAAVLVAFGWASYRTWLRSLETLPPEGPGFGISPTPLTLYAWGASALLVGVLVLAGLEYLVRRTLGIAPPPSLVGDGSRGERR
ncbi:hypothetical protein [Natronobeatus ordinarius]|uniref:hypothetical protein n=1 Tax=Natronobeatus ordinarius TaxID=2963433 RepID=UPI0020CBF2DF|nr:hypothetical protein [Natronobeatus ordinarius]